LRNRGNDVYCGGIIIGGGETFRQSLTPRSNIGDISAVSAILF